MNLIMAPKLRQFSLLASTLLIMALALLMLASRSQQGGKPGPPLHRKAWNGWASVEKIFVLYDAPGPTSKRQKH